MLEGAMFLDESLLVGARWRDESATIHPHTWHLPWAPKRRQVGEEEQRRTCEGTINGDGTLVATQASAVKLTSSKADTMFNPHGPTLRFVLAICSDRGPGVPLRQRGSTHETPPITKFSPW